MNLYLLGGSGKKNIDWVESIEKEVKDLFDTTVIQRYEHWDLEEKVDINLEKEAINLAKLIGTDKTYIIFAKSAGILTALKAIKENSLTPKACLFCGFPLLWAEERDIPAARYLQKHDLPTTFIQNDADPFCSASKLKILLEKMSCINYKFIEEEGDTHNYNNSTLIKEILHSYLKN